VKPRADAPHSYVRSVEVYLTITIESVRPDYPDDELGEMGRYLETKAMSRWPSASVVEVGSAVYVQTPEDHAALAEIMPDTVRPAPPLPWRDAGGIY
jgi:hypothetical protein